MVMRGRRISKEAIYVQALCAGEESEERLDDIEIYLYNSLETISYEEGSTLDQIQPFLLLPKPIFLLVSSLMNKEASQYD